MFSKLNKIVRFTFIMVMDTKFLGYSLVGVLNTGITLGIMFLLMSLNVNYLISNSIGYVVGAINSFFFNKRFVFKSKSVRIDQFLKFIFMMLACYFIQYAFLFFFVEFLRISEYLSQVLANGLYSILFYVSCKYIVFDI